jgi:hypothetical protein
MAGRRRPRAAARALTRHTARAGEVGATPRHVLLAALAFAIGATAATALWHWHNSR